MKSLIFYFDKIVLFLCSFLLFFLIFVPNCVKTQLFDTYFLTTECVLIQRYFWSFLNMFELFFCVLGVFLTQRIYRSNLILNETLYLTIFNYLYFNFLNIFLVFFDTSGLCVGPLPFIIVMKDMRHLIGALIMIGYPIVQGRIGGNLPISLVLRDVELFLNEGEGFKVFYKFLQGLEKKGESIIEKNGNLFFFFLYFIIFCLLTLLILINRWVENIFLIVCSFAKS